MNKKLLSLGSLVLVATPALVVSCGSSKEETKKEGAALSPKITTPNTHIDASVPLPKDEAAIYDHVFDNAIRIRNVKDQNINWSLFASEGNTTFSANDYHVLMEKASVRKTWLDKFKASYDVFANDVYDSTSQTDFTYKQHYIDIIASGGAKNNPLASYTRSGLTASHITNIAVIENSNTASTLKQRILVRFENGIMNGFVEFEVKGTLESPTFRLTGPAGTSGYTPSSDIKFVARSSRSILQSVPATAFVVKNGWLSNIAEPIWWYDHIMHFINTK